MLSNFVVTDTLDDTNTGSLRWAIQQANIAGGEIDFNISGSGVQTINISSPLPALSFAGTTVDATTQPGYTAAGHPLITINGTNAGTGTDGLQLTSIAQTVKGLAIDDFGGAGVYVGSGGSLATISQNYLGLDATGTTAAGNAFGVMLGSLADNSNILSNVISGNVVISGVNASGSGIYINGADTTINAVHNTLIQGNLIGTRADGKEALSNEIAGVYDSNSVNTHIGGTTSLERNIISGNNVGLDLLVSTGMVIEGNYIGPDVTGETAIGSVYNGNLFTGDGILLQGASDLLIGGTTAGSGNVISGNTSHGIDSFVIGSSGITVQGNYVGLDATGMQPMGNTSDGVYISGPTDVVIGGPTASARNVIANNGAMGIDSFASVVNWTIQGNYIGTDVTATKIMGNQGDGIMIWAPNNLLIGGTSPGDANVIVNNKSFGINTFASGDGAATIEGNFIGTDPTGTIAMGNGAAGVDVTITDVTVGGTAAGAANVIANNGYTDAFVFSGVRVTSSDIPILSNSIYNNKQLGIDLNGGQGNNNQPAPVLGNALTANGSTTFTGTLNAAASTTFTIQFFSNTSADPSGAYEGRTYLGSTTVTTNASGLATIDATIAVSPTPGQVITATATDPAGNTSQFSVGKPDMPPNADLALTTSVSASTVNVKQDVTYTLTITNNGPSTSTGVVLTDDITSALNFISATTTQGSTPTDSNGTVTANIGSILSGSTVTVTITVQATTSAPPAVSTMVNVTSTLLDTNLANNSATIVTNVNPLIDLALTASGSPSTVLVGQNLTYTFTVQNNGPSPATGVVFMENLPSGATFVSVTSTVGTASQSAGIVTADLGSLAALATATITVIVKPGATAPPSITTTASVTGNETDTNSANNSATVMTAVNPSVDLAVGITASPAPVGVGQNLTYTITVTNSGPSPATGVILTQNLPSGVTFVSATTTGGTASQAAGVVTANLGTLAALASATITVIVKPGVSAPPSVTSTASVTANETDTNSTNNSAMVTTTVSPVTDLAVGITASPSPVDVGTNLIYTVTVTNNGPSAATGIILTDLLPSTATFVFATTDTGGPPTVASGTLTTDIGNLASGATARVTIVVTPTAPSAPSIIATASVVDNQIDPTSSNNTASVTTTVTPVADVNIAALSTNAPYVLVGEPVTYTIVVMNSGPSPAVGVVFVQDLHSGFTVVSATPSVGTASDAGLVVTANLGTLAPGAMVTIVVVATPDNSAIGQIDESEMTVSSATLDLSTNNNFDSVPVEVDPSADLSLTLTPSAGSVPQGFDLTYTFVVTNHGPSNATGIVLYDTLPTGATLVSAVSDTGETPMSYQGQLTASIGNLAVGASAKVTIVVLPDETSTSVTDSAHVAANEFDIHLADNSASVTTAVTPASDLAVAITPQPGTALTGSPFVYTLKVSNKGPSDASNVTLTADLPPGLNFTSADPNFSAVAVNGGIVTMTVGALNAGATGSYSLTVTPVAPGSPTVSVTVQSSESDPVSSNNIADVGTTVITPPGTFTFSASGYTVDETAGVALITVNRLNGYQGLVSVHFTTAAGGSATPGVDFGAIDETLVFGQGETSKTLAVPVLPDPNDNHDETVVLKLDSPSGGANLGDPTTSLLTIRDIDPVTVGPKVTDVRLVGSARSITRIDVVMSEPLDPSTVSSLGFMVAEVGTFGNLGVAPATVSYDAGLGIVSLTPVVPLPAGRFYEIRVVGTGPNEVKDLAGNPLNSTLGAAPGSDVVETFARGTTLRYTDENGTRVTLQIRGGGVIDLNRDASGHVSRLQLVGVVPRRTALYGTVRGGVTTIDTILGTGIFGSVRHNLPIPPFQVTHLPYQLGVITDPPAVDTLLPSFRPFSSVRGLKALMSRKIR